MQNLALISLFSPFVAFLFASCFALSEIENHEERMKQGVKFFKQWGAYAPAFGMIGTLVGLIQLLGNMEDITKLVAGMAFALITTALLSLKQYFL